LSRADSQARAEQYRTGIQNGYKLINEVRRLNNDNPLEGGDRAFIQSNMIPIDVFDQLVKNKDSRLILAEALAEKIKKDENVV